MISLRLKHIIKTYDYWVGLTLKKLADKKKLAMLTLK